MVKMVQFVGRMFYHNINKYRTSYHGDLTQKLKEKVTVVVETCSRPAPHQALRKARCTFISLELRSSVTWLLFRLLSQRALEEMLCPRACAAGKK